jgi:hypothetical protein
MVSTPNRPGGLFESIELEPADKCLYTCLFLNYIYGLNKIYSEEKIANAMASLASLGNTALSMEDVVETSLVKIV